MIEKRKVERRPTNLNVEYKVAEMEFGQATWVETNGTIIDISDKGFGMTTSHPLQKGHVIMIKKGENPDVPLFGLVKWIEKKNDFYRAGFGYRYED
jgi:hypothetical protein